MDQSAMVQESITNPIPTIHVISDSVGVTAQAVARAAAAQFGENNPKIEVMSKAKRFADIKAFIDMHKAVRLERSGDGRLLIFFTLVDRKLRNQLIEYAQEDEELVLVDLMTDAVEAISNLSGRCPAGLPGSLHAIDSHYFQRVEALEFTIAHDDGRNPQELTRADIVLLGRVALVEDAGVDLPVAAGLQGRQHPAGPLDRAAARDLRRRPHAPVRFDDDARGARRHPPASAWATPACVASKLRRPRIRLPGSRAAHAR